ncbi:cobalamin biosynthesis protein CobD [Desulfohalobiaceae bacterium Ax17]|uniref:adenosylcobinamide-phosphate synthase CbiB n=1 Tax=Desulfovulcanus ferrireducens TaxID=2831190 RepID=UPI00207BC94E|nr:adenosylcobinamide-phosphate synthase CbiB [Desulfovulcanus ferrireducens]MBT8763592.1 cobalamin biosynthesis protein CobD [Desulfovulcanus ferrireducens]
MNEFLIFISLCFGLDLLLGDPGTWPHPVRFVGCILNFFEKFFRKLKVNLYLAGFLALITGSVGIGCFVNFLTTLPVIGNFFAFYLGYAALALGSLIREGRKVLSLLTAGELEEARHALSFLVSRDTRVMDEQEVCRALVETLSENFNDGFCAPFFYLALGGPAGVWVYKFVSTMDSMWGYKNRKWRQLGFAGARADDILAFIPARLSALLLWLAAKVLRLPVAVKWKEVLEDARKTESPNAGWPMAMAAHILQVELGGPAVYFDQLKDKPKLGPSGREITAQKIEQLISIILTAGFLFFGAVIVTGLVFL